MNPPDKKDVDRVLAWPTALREGEWKLRLGEKPELYNISEDRNEIKNLAAEFPESVQKMEQVHAGQTAALRVRGK